MLEVWATTTAKLKAKSLNTRAGSTEERGKKVSTQTQEQLVIHLVSGYL